MNFQNALNSLRKGHQVTRELWNTNKFIILQKGYPEGIIPNEQTTEVWDIKKGEMFKCNPYFQIKNEDGTHSMYHFTNDDILASDWSLTVKSKLNNK